MPVQKIVDRFRSMGYDVIGHVNGQKATITIITDDTPNKETLVALNEIIQFYKRPDVQVALIISPRRRNFNELL